MENSCRLLSYVDSFVHGELNNDERRMFAEHISACDICSAEVQRAAQLKDSLSAAYATQLDERFNYGILRSLRGHRQIKPAGEIRVALEDIVISLAAMVAIVLLGIQLFSTSKVSSMEMVGQLTNIEKSSIEQTSLSNDQVLELVLRSK